MKQCLGEKVEGQRHQVTRHGSTKTQNISCKRHPVVEILLFYKNWDRQGK